MTTARKRQVWLRPDECELIHMCLCHVRDKLNEDGLSSRAHRMAARFTRQQISALLPLFAPKTEVLK